MIKSLRRPALSLLLACGTTLATAAMAEDVSFVDPSGDDHGPGTYLYPTDAVYTPGSFDLTEFEVADKGKSVNFSVSVNERLRDPWGMEVGFAIQMIFVFIDVDGEEGSGHTEGLPGLNITFDPAHAWEKVVLLSPQQQSRVTSEIRAKLDPALAEDVIAPRRTGGSGKTISAKVKKDEIADGDPATWSYQVVMQSNEGFPRKQDLLTRLVNEYEGQHRFGGGSDYDCDPHVMDVLAGDGDGSDDEVDLQHEMLSYECGEEGETLKGAVLTMVNR